MSGLTAEQRAERLAEIRAIASLVHGGPDMVNMRFLLAEIDRLTAERDAARDNHLVLARKIDNLQGIVNTIKSAAESMTNALEDTASRARTGKPRRAALAASGAAGGG